VLAARRRAVGAFRSGKAGSTGPGLERSPSSRANSAKRSRGSTRRAARLDAAPARPVAQNGRRTLLLRPAVRRSVIRPGREDAFQRTFVTCNISPLFCEGRVERSALRGQSATSLRVGATGAGARRRSAATPGSATPVVRSPSKRSRSRSWAGRRVTPRRLFVSRPTRSRASPAGRSRRRGTPGHPATCRALRSR
jgi:hypothetical protein